jgi:hypothetical protein
MNISAVGDAFSKIYGLPAWQVRKGVGSFLTLEFGEPHLQIRAPYSSQSEPPFKRMRLVVKLPCPASGIFGFICATGS